MPVNDDGKRALVKTLETTQAVTGLCISIYTTAHLLNHFAFHFVSLDGHSAILRSIRKRVGDRPVVEFSLLFAIFVHSISSVLKFAINNDEDDWRKTSIDRGLHRLTGWILLLAMPAHVAYTRWLPKRAGLKEVDVSLAAMASRLIPLFFVPYYIILASSGVLHTLSGVLRASRALNLFKRAKPSGKIFRIYAASLTILGASSALAISGMYFRYDMKRELEWKHHYLKSGLWPAFLSSRIYFEHENSWFAKFRMF